jgi:hypothetical protein
MEVPAFVKKGQQINPDQGFNTKCVANTRIFVEDAIEGIKSFLWLSEGCIHLTSRHLIDYALKLAAHLTNLTRRPFISTEASLRTPEQPSAWEMMFTDVVCPLDS